MAFSLDLAIDKLFELVYGRLAVTQPDCQVLDGPSIDDVGQDVVAIGITAEDSSTQGEISIGGLRAEKETYELQCLVRSWTGDSDLSLRRARAFELFEEVASIVRDNPTLDGVVAKARIAGFSYNPARIPEGAIASVSFRVRITAFTR